MSKPSHPTDTPIWTHWFGPLPQNLLPSTPVRYVGEALVLGTLAFVVLSLALVGGLWHRLPVFGDAFTAYIGPNGQVVPLPLELHLKLWLEIPFRLWSHGRFFGAQVSAYASLVQQLPFAMFYGRLLFAASLALAVAAYITKLALRPRDRLIHAVAPATADVVRARRVRSRACCQRFIAIEKLPRGSEWVKSTRRDHSSVHQADLYLLAFYLV